MPPKGIVETFEPSEPHRQFLRSHGLTRNPDGGEYWSSELGQEQISKALCKMLRWDYPQVEQLQQGQNNQVSRGLSRTWYNVRDLIDEFTFRSKPSLEQAVAAIRASRSDQGRRFDLRYFYDVLEDGSYRYEVTVTTEWLEFAHQCHVKGKDIYGNILGKGKDQGKDHHEKGKGKGKGKDMGKMQGQKGPAREPPGPPEQAIVLVAAGAINVREVF